jgi:tetratricopeptide (TPR) repeat protein
MLVLAIALAAVVFIIGPQQQLRQQAQVTAEARQAEVERLYAAGLAFQNASDWEAAEAEFKKVIALDANYKDVPTRLAEVKARLADSEATATAVAAARTEQARIDAQATATARIQATAEAQANATATAEVAPTATLQALEAHYQKGLAHMNLGRWVEAKAELEQVFDVDPNYKEVQAKLAEVEAEVAKLTPTATRTPAATSTPTVTPTPPTVTLKPKSAISFQNEGTTSTDDTTLVQDKDGFWAPSLTGTVTQDYFATGDSPMFFDALSLQFDVGDWSYQNYRAVLRAFVQHGDDRLERWNHYLALPGKQNPDYQDAIPFDVPNAQVIDYSTGKWIEIELTPKFWSEGVIWVTLRLWNIRVDAVELVLTPK